MSRITTQTSIESLLQSIEEFGNRNDWDGVQITLEPDGSGDLWKPMVNPTGNEIDGWDVGESFRSIEELSELLEGRGGKTEKAE